MLKHAVPGDKTGGIITVAQEPPAVVKQLVVRMPHGVGVRALKANPLAHPALLWILKCEIFIPQHLVYDVAWNIYSGACLHGPVQTHGTQMIPRSGSKHCRVLQTS